MRRIRPLAISVTIKAPNQPDNSSVADRTPPWILQQCWGYRLNRNIGNETAFHPRRLGPYWRKFIGSSDSLPYGKSLFINSHLRIELPHCFGMAFKSLGLPFFDGPERVNGFETAA